MAAFMEAAGVRIAFGVVWKQVDEKHEKSQAAALVRKHKAAYKIRWASGAAVRYGVATQAKSAAENRKKSTVLSGAALFASQIGADGNALLILPMDAKHSKYALVALVDGAPYLDLVIAPNHIRERVESLREEGHGTYAEFGSHPDFPSATDWKIGDLIGESAAQSTMTKAVVRRPFAMKVAMGAVLFAAIGGAYTWDYMEQQREEEEANKAVVDPVADYKRFLSQVLSGASVSGNAAFSAFWSPLAERQVTAAGWAIEKIACNRTACVEDWARHGGTNEAFIEQLPKGARYDLGTGKAKPDALKVVRAFDAKPVSVDAARLPAGEAFWVNITSLAQRLAFDKDLIGEFGVDYSIESAKVLGSGSGVPKNLVVEQGQFTVTGPLGLMKETLTTMQDNVSIDEISLDLAGGGIAAKFTVKGSYYVKN
jgi:hypothetical protein